MLKWFLQKNILNHIQYGVKSFDEYCSKIPEFYFKKEVPEDVIKNFEIIERLMAFSYYEYRFIDEAYAKALFTFEMAMGIRLKDFDPKSKKDRFQALITKLTSHNAFDTDIKTLRHVKDMRDYYSHPERHSFGGIVFWNRIEFINRLINEMYEDIEIRKDRIKKTDLFSSKLLESKLNQYCVVTIKKDNYLLFKSRFLLLNNKLNPNTYLLECVPLFEVNPNKDGSHYMPNNFPVRLINPNFIGNALEGKCYYTNNNIYFSQVEQDPVFESITNNWKNKYEQLDNKFIYESDVSKIFIPAVQEYQRM